MLEALAPDLRGERLDLVQIAEHPLGDRQPAETTGDLGCARRSPQRGVAVSQPLRDVSPLGRAHPPGHCRGELWRKTSLDGEELVAHATIVVAATGAALQNLCCRGRCPL